MNSKNLLTILGITIAILLIPVIANWPWSLSDFIIMGVLIFITGLGVEFVRMRNGKNKILGIFAIIIIFLYVWAELAVGIFTNLGS